MIQAQKVIESELATTEINISLTIYFAFKYKIMI